MDSITSQTRGTWWVTSHKMVSYDLLLHLFPTFSPLTHGPKITRLDKIHISTRKSSLSEVNTSPMWINTIGYIPLKIMYDYPVFFTMIANNLSSNTIPNMVVPFYWFLCIYKKISKRGRGKGYMQKLRNSIIEENIKLDAAPNLF